jgi:hypothetical protein
MRIGNEHEFTFVGKASCPRCQCREGAQRHVAMMYFKVLACSGRFSGPLGVFLESSNVGISTMNGERRQMNCCFER